MFWNTTEKKKASFTYQNFGQVNVKGNLSSGAELCSVTCPEDITYGNFVVPDNMIAVSFDYQRITKNGKDKKLEGVSTGRFYASAEIYDCERMKEEFGEQNEIYQKMVDKNEPYAVKARDGHFYYMNEKDVVISGKNGNWQIAGRHPNAKGNPLYVNEMPMSVLSNK